MPLREQLALAGRQQREFADQWTEQVIAARLGALSQPCRAIKRSNSMPRWMLCATSILEPVIGRSSCRFAQSGYQRVQERKETSVTSRVIVSRFRQC